jgi:small conductance mechanosensitive channel
MESETPQLLRELLQAATPFLLDLFAAVVILAVGWIFAGWVQRAVRSSLERVEPLEPTFRAPIASGARYAVLVFVVIAVLAKFGVQTTSLLAVLGAAGLAVGLALQGTLSNIAAGMMLLFLRPFKTDEYIDADGIAGTIKEVGLFTTELSTYDGVYLSVPNAQLWNRPIKNFSRLPTRRVDLAVGISYGDDIDAAMAALSDELAKDERVLSDPAPQVMVKELADSSVNINLRCWTNAADYWDLLFDLTRRSKQRLDAEGITIPFPQRDVHVIERRSEGKPRAAEAAA